MNNCERHVLVVEDNAAMASVIRFNLEQVGFQVTTAVNGRIAWEQVQQQQFDIILTDQQMPVMTGYEFCERMRELENYRETPVIMLTAKGFELELSQLRKTLGISELFTKPFSPKRIIKAVEDRLAAVR